MPPRKGNYKIVAPEWIERSDDPCLYTILLEALVARSFAIRWGAMHDKSARGALDAADLTLRQIEDGRVSGEIAWYKATAALRKYTQAGERAQHVKRIR
jgi:hypothetical protein